MPADASSTAPADPIDPWEELTRRTLAEIEDCPAVYRPTNFWAPGLDRLLAEMRGHGLPAFKSWPSATWWFYPTYGANLGAAEVEAMVGAAEEHAPGASRRWLSSWLTGAAEARRDFDAVRLAWDQQRWPFRIQRFGESKLGEPVQRFRLTGRGTGWTKPYLNYLLCLAALSRHVDRPPQSVLEIGGGFGVLGEILMRRNPHLRYVDLDIPPLVTVASYYLRELFGDRVTIYDESYPGRVPDGESAVLPNWRIDDVDGPFDLFVNSFSFQEMEPDVVEHYVAQVAAKDVEYVVSLNSRRGKNKASDHGIGVLDPVTSDRIVAMFEAHGYAVLGRYGEPLIRSAGELVVLRRPRPGEAAAPAPVTRRVARRARSLAGRAVRRARSLRA